MSFLELVVLILVIGFVSMIEICAITVCVGKTLDAKMKARTEMELKIFDKEMEYFDKVLTKFVDGLSDIFKKERT